MVIAAAVITPIGGWQAVGVAADPVALLAGIGVGVASSVIAGVALHREAAEPSAPLSPRRAALPAAFPRRGARRSPQRPTVRDRQQLQ